MTETFFNFESNIRESLEELHIKKDFCDLTLACDGYKVETHKIVVAGNSPVLQNILKLNKNPHPFIYFRSITYKDLQNLINFIYQGEVNIANEDINSFIELAKDLKVKGIMVGQKKILNLNDEDFDQYQDQNVCKPSSKRKRNVGKENHNENGDNSNNRKCINNAEPLSKKVQKRLVRQELNKLAMIDDINKDIVMPDTNNDCKNEIFLEEDKDLKNTDFFERSNTFTSNDNSIRSDDNKGESAVDQSVETNSQLSNNLQSFEVKKETINNCIRCNKTFATSSSLYRHIQSIHEGTQFPCSQCDYSASQRSNLKTHISSMHEGVGYHCNLCDYKSAQKSQIKGHMLSKHSCKLCDYQEATKEEIKKHMESAHPKP